MTNRPIQDNFLNTATEIDDEIKLEIFGHFISKVYHILSPKPINIWHVPGALPRIISSMICIFDHGYKHTAGNSNLWSFIFGLRVLRPDLWPDFELKLNYESKTNPFTHWLKLSLQSYSLREQVKALLYESERLHSHYHEGAFLCTQKYASALLIVLEALEKNSQDILATVDSSLMVQYYNKHKNISSDSNCNIKNAVPLKPNLQSSINMNSDKKCNVINNDTLENMNTHEAAAEERYHRNSQDLSSYQVSPSCLEIDYSVTVFSDTEKKNEDETSYSESRMLDPLLVEQKRVKPKRKINRNAKDVNYTSSSTDASKKTLILNNFYSSDMDIISPSNFLLEYLASKPNIYERRKSLLPIDVSDSDAGFVTKNDAGSSEGLKKINNRDKAVDSPNLIHELVTKCERKPKNSKHVRSFSDGSKIILSKSATDITQSKCSFSKISQERESLLAKHNESKELVRKRFMEDGGHSIVPEADGFFPCPQPGQNLMDFLSSSHLYQTGAQLDRENAHFNIAEAVIAAIEQMNYESVCLQKETRKKCPCNLDESEDDWVKTKSNFQSRRRPRLRSRILLPDTTSDEEPVTTDYSMFDSPKWSDDSTDSELINKTSEEGPSYTQSSDEQSEQSNDPYSAESVAISLLKHYNANLLPQATELQWLVTEQDAPQKLLPLPNSVPVSPDDVDSSYFMPLLRGTSDWAPPRPQLVLTLHSNRKRTAHLTAQKWRCAGCGLRVSEKLSRHFRFCHYLGRYFCTNCHNNKKTIIPARVLHKWDFRKEFVCNFSSELLSRMAGDPLFHVGTLNPKLYKLSLELQQTHIYRLQLFHARFYIIICSRARKEKALLEAAPLHWSTEPHLYSLDDLISVKSGQIVSVIKQLTVSCIDHISKCKVCLGQGFICEMCRSGSPIFPFQLDAVTQCTKCHQCFHFLCFSPTNDCSRCVRRERRLKESEAEAEIRFESEKESALTSQDT